MAKDIRTREAINAAFQVMKPYKDSMALFR